MWSAIALAAARQVRVARSLPMRDAGRLVLRVAPRPTTVIPSGVRVAAVFARGLAEARRGRGRPPKSGTAVTGTKTKLSAAGKPARKKKTAKAKAKKAAKKKTAKKLAKPRKELTEEEKTKLEIKALKKKALLRVPKKLPETSWMVFCNQRMREEWTERFKGIHHSEKDVLMRQAMIRAGEAFRGLSAAELANLQAKAQENRAANVVALKAWVASHTPQQIKDANAARRALRLQHGVKSRRRVPDPRIPKSPMSGYRAFTMSRFRAPEYHELQSPERFTRISEEWRHLSEEERKPFHAIAKQDLDRYITESEASFGRTPKPRRASLST